MRWSRLIVMLALALSALALWASPAGAESTYNQLLQIYDRTGSIPACSFTSAQLEGVLGSVDTYAAQYFSDFTNAIGNALAARASGACSSKHAVAPSGVTGNARLALPGTPAATGASVPLPIVLLAAIGAALLLLGGGAVALRLTGWEPGWAPAWRHSWDEAEYRLCGGWVALRERLRRRGPRRGS